MMKNAHALLASAAAISLMVGATIAPAAKGEPRKWFTMKADQEKKTAEIMIYDAIGKSFWDDETVSAKAFDEDLKALGQVDEITLRVNSPGGDVFDGLAIFNTLKNHPARVVARIDGIAASAASLVVMAADEIVIPENGFMLIHEPRTICWGTSEQIMAVAADLETMTATFAATYAQRSGTAADKIETIMAEDRLMTADEAVELGLADRKADAVKMAASYSMALLPESARAKIEAAIAASAPTPAAPPPAAPSNVVNLDDVRAEALSQGRAAAKEIVDMCALAGMPERASAFIAADTPVAEVRAALLAEKAAKDQQLQHHKTTIGASTQAGADGAWKKAIDSINSRV